MLSMSVMKTKNQGFTIVELLIVIVVIAILAAISIVAYGGIQDRARTTAGAQLATSIAKKAVVYRTIRGELPSYAQIRSSSAPEEARLSESELYSTDQRPNPFTAGAADNGKRVAYWMHTCGRVTLVYWDYSTSQQMRIVVENGISSPEPRGTTAVSMGCG